MSSKSYDGIAEILKRKSAERDNRVAELRKYAGQIDADRIASLLGCTERAIRSLAYRAGISLRVKGRVWTEEEERFVRLHAKTKSLSEIAAELGRSEISVQSFCQYRQIPRIKSGEAHHASTVSDDDVELCRQLHDERVPLKVIARKMELNLSLVHSIVYHRRS